MKTHQPGATIERSKNMKYILLMNGTKANFAEYAKSSEPLDALSEDPRLAEHRRLNAVRAHLLELAGDCRAATTHYRTAAARTASLPERNYLLSQAARLSGKSAAE
jgi:predicted RNA polymerase sigma factor